MSKKQKFIFLFLSILGLLLLGLYGSTFTADFLPWDDDYNIALNPIYTRGTWLRFWSEAFYGMYIPVTNSIWGILFDIGNGSAFPYRLFNFGLHCLNVCLLGAFLNAYFNKLKIDNLSLWAFSVAVFALHPLQVETVAWISGGRDLLSTSFALLSLLAFFHFQNWKGFALGGLFFVLGLLSKPQIASLPAAIFLLEYLIEPNRWKKTAAQMALWSLPVLGIVILTFSEQKNYVNLTVEPWQRTLVVLDSFGFYLSKLLLPLNLMVDYGRNPQNLTESFQDHWPPLAFFLASSALMIFLFLRKRKTQAFFTFFAWAACLLPVSGIIDFAFQEISTTADHYAYFPMIAFSLFLAVCLRHLPSVSNPIFLSLPLAICASWSYLSWQRVHVWQDRFVFFEDMLKGNPKSYSALIGMGGNSALKNDNLMALQYYQEALAQRPADVAATANILSSLFRLQRYSEVMKNEEFLLTENFKKTLEIRHLAAANMLTTFGSAAYVLNQLDLSRLYMCEAFHANPYSPPIQNAMRELSQILKQKNRPAACPENPTDEEFFKSVVDSISSRKR